METSHMVVVGIVTGLCTGGVVILILLIRRSKTYW